MAVRHESTLINFQSFCLLSQRQDVNRAWKGMWLTIISKIWNHINNVVFKGGVVDVEKIFSLTQLKG